MKPKKLSEETVQRSLTQAVKDAVAFIESEIAPDRIKAQKYFEGKVDVTSPPGRSKVVATKARDTLRAIKPGLMRTFMQSHKPVEFIPRRPDAVDEAEQKTNFAQYTFERNGGFQLLSDAIDDALRKKVGILKVWYSEEQEVDVNEYSGLTGDQVALLDQDPDIEILDAEQEEGIWEVTASKTSKSGEIKIRAIAPEDFFVDVGATSIDDAFVSGHSTKSRVGDVVAMGFDFDKVYELSGETEKTEASDRVGMGKKDQGAEEDPSMREILLTEAYMRMDIDGLGVPKLYKFICGGEDYTILDRELADVNPFAVFEVDPEPHTFFGRSLVEIILDDQDASTALLRGLLDNMAMVNNPRMEAVESQVNIDDLLNNEIGGIIRTKAPGLIREITVGSMAQSILPAIGYYDEIIRGKTGVSGAGMGMDADMLQSQTAQGVNAAVQAANQVADLIARHLAEGGMRQLFVIIAQLARQHPNPEEMMRINGQFVPVDTSSWSPSKDMMVNVGLGTNGHDQKVAALQMTMQDQQNIWQAYGPTNGMVTMTNMRNTRADLLQLAGLHNAERYYSPMNPQIEQQLMQAAAQAAQAAQGQQQASDPNAAFLQAEQMKTSARVQADIMKVQLDAQKAAMDDDFRRDELAQNLLLDGAKIVADTGVRLNTEALKREQAMPRPVPGMPQ